MRHLSRSRKHLSVGFFFIVALMVFYMLALMAWAFVAEIGAVRAEEAEQRILRTPASGVEPRPYERLSH